MVTEATWPDETVELPEALRWASASLDGQPEVGEPIQILGQNNWGFTARLTVRTPCQEQAVVFKTSRLPPLRASPPVCAVLSRHCPGDVPHLLAWRAQRDRVDRLFHVFHGEQVATTGSLGALQEMARTLARVQTRVAVLPPPETAGLPRLPLSDVPALLDSLMSDIHERYLDRFAADDGSLIRRFGIPEDLLARLAYFRPRLDEWAEELQASGWPESLDHVDFLPHNAVVQENGRALVYDWEQAAMGCPFFSLDILLAFAQDYRESFATGLELHAERDTEGASAVRRAYLAALPWKTPEERERAFALAMCLSPVRYAWAEGLNASKFGQEEWWAEDMAWWIMRALQRWERLDPVGQ